MAIPPEVLERLRARAEQEGVSMSALVLRAIRRLLDEDAKGPEPTTIEERLKVLEEKLRKLEG